MAKYPRFDNKKAIIPIFFVSILWFLYGGQRWYWWTSHQGDACHDGERGAFKSERTKLARTTEAVIRATTYIPQNNTSNEVLFCGGVRAT